MKETEKKKLLKILRNWKKSLIGKLIPYETFKSE